MENFIDIFENKKPKRINKGKSLKILPNDYTVVDLETTGLDASFDEIIELAALKVRNGEVINSFQSLIKPEDEIDEFIASLTGITNEMVSSAPCITLELPIFLDFVGNDIIVGHNINFDINFLYDNSMRELNEPFNNNYADTLRFSRRLYPDIHHHSLSYLIDYLHLENDEKSHRGIADCKSALMLYKKIQEKVITENIDLQQLFTPARLKDKCNPKNIVPTTEDFDIDNPLYGKHCVFTGTLSKMARKDAMQIVVNLGGFCDGTVTKKTNYLILGETDYALVKDGKSGKRKKAEELIIKGQDLNIISENVFYDFIK